MHLRAIVVPARCSSGSEELGNAGRTWGSQPYGMLRVSSNGVRHCLLGVTRAAAAVPVFRDTCPHPGLLRLCSTTSRKAGSQQLCTAKSAAKPQLDQLLHTLCFEYGIQSKVTVGAGRWRLGLFQQVRQHEPAETTTERASSNSSASVNQPARPQQDHGAPDSCGSHQQQQLLVSVPLHLVLSCHIPGCSPSPHEMPAELHQLLHNSCCSKAWELQVAALLLWAIRQPADTAVGGFWSRYATALLPPITDQQSLLLWSEEELRLLQDDQLTATAVAWQQQVQETYHGSVKPCFGRMYAAGSADERHDRMQAISDGAGSAATSNSRAQVLSCTLQEWIWAVATVESRAFGVTKGTMLQTPDSSRSIIQVPADTGSAGSKCQQDVGSTYQHYAAAASTAAGQCELVGLVPVLDLANHTCHTDCHHTVDQSSSTFNLYKTKIIGDSLISGGSCSPAAAAEEEILITYGEKDNRQLMEQYGFCVPDNPFDRVQLPRQQDQQLFTSHKAVKQAAELVKQQRLLQQSQPHNSTALRHVASSPVVHASFDGAATHHTSPEGAALQFSAGQVDAALASVISSAGWRNLREYRQVSASSTVHCAALLLTAVQVQLQAFSTSLQEDLELLQQHQAGRQPAESAIAGLAQVSERKWQSALQYRVGRKQMLTATERVLKEVISMHSQH